MISCILPTNRGGNWVSQRLNELALSTFTDLEIIIVEDGIVEPYIIPDGLKVKVIKMDQNSGSVSIPRAVGLSYATGKYIAHTDDDVIIYKDKFDILIKNIKDAWICYGSRVERYLPHTPKNNTARVFLNFVNTPNWDPRTTWGVDGGQFIYKSEVWKKNKFIFPKRGCDWETAKLVMTTCPMIRSVFPAVCEYIWHDKNRSLDESTKSKDIYPEQFKKYFNPEFINF
jgi:glycosyltransferase involved in cell wall biosynthesis